jgi:hypothetical protein
MSVVVPDLVGKKVDIQTAGKMLDALGLRHQFSLTTTLPMDGLAWDQAPAAGTAVKLYTVVKVRFRAADDIDLPVGGAIPKGGLQGKITGVSIDEHEVAVDVTLEDAVPISYVLYRVRLADDDDLPRAEWMRRGAMLGLAQRALTNQHRVDLFVTEEHLVGKMRVFRT